MTSMSSNGTPSCVGDDLAPRRLVALAVRRRAGDDLDLAGGQHPDRRVLPAAGDVLERAEDRDGARPHISVNVEMPMPSCTGSPRLAPLGLLGPQRVVVEQLGGLAVAAS
jgi:hypothetical protein